ncbi:dipeptidase [Telmatocola sphagniphila]|uniref:Dipeptidase n=1 Tax=Telmatocola sphagniphila TaxID=1123043 RepID=A0A8E6ESB7_9BACT|nr:dipeptidase [Telmatocola sphagniphila]QVL30484.1 dipeptidase [Telmatocola sphagniphila]
MTHRYLLLFAAALGVFPAPLVAQETKSKRGLVTVTPEALAIHQEAIVVDGHNDLPWQYRAKKDFSFKTIDITKNQPELHTDLPRLRKGGMGAQFWAAYVDASVRPRSQSVKETLEQIDVIHRMVKTYPQDLEMAYTVDDILRIHKTGKIASLIGVEGGHSIDNSIGTLRTFYMLGVRYMTLTHSETLDWADSATDKPKNNGLSPFGEEIVHEMNRLGMMVDLSHVSPDTMRHVLRITKVPVIFSHSSARAIADHPRNVPDDVLKEVKKNNGVVMVNFFPGFVSPEGARLSQRMFEEYREMKEKIKDEKELERAWKEHVKAMKTPPCSIHDVVDHIEHIIKVAGIDHVGLGSDFDGISAVPTQLEDVSTYPKITQELLNRGYKKEEILKVLGSNLLRVMRAVEQAAAK